MRINTVQNALMLSWFQETPGQVFRTAHADSAGGKDSCSLMFWSAS